MVLERVVVTGASGMIGRHVLDTLASQGVFCVATSSSCEVRHGERISWRHWDMRVNRDFNELDDLFGGVNAVVHAGGIVPNFTEISNEQDMFEVNVRSCLTIGLWSASRGVPFVFISGSIIYADQYKNGIKESDRKAYGHSETFYGLTKILAEEILLDLREKGLQLTVLRPSSVYGHGLHYTKMITSLLLRASRGETLEIYPPVDDRVDLIYAGDVAQAITEAIKRETKGIFNIAGGTSYTMYDIAEACADVVGKGSIRIMPGKTGRRPVSRFALDCTAARDSFGFVAGTQLRDGLKLMWDKIQLHGAL